MNVRIVRSPCDIALSPEWLKTARLARSSASRRMSLHRTTSRRSAWRREPQPRAIGQPGNMGSVLAGDTIVGDREPRRFVDDKRVRVGAEAGVVVERGQRRCRRAPRRGGGLCAARVSLEFRQHQRAAHFAKAAVSARRRPIERHKLLAGEKAEIGSGACARVRKQFNQDVLVFFQTYLVCPDREQARTRGCLASAPSPCLLRPMTQP